MRYSIVFISRTGNTQRVAEAIRDALPADELVWFGEPGPKALDADLIFAGSWTDKGTCDEGMEVFLSHLEGKRVALFGTAGFGGSETYFQSILGRMEAYIPKTASVREGFLCTGRMGPGLRERYAAALERDPADARARMMLDAWEHAKDHPDGADLDGAAAWARGVYAGA